MPQLPDGLRGLPLPPRHRVLGYTSRVEDGADVVCPAGLGYTTEECRLPRWCRRCVVGLRLRGTRRSGADLTDMIRMCVPVDDDEGAANLGWAPADGALRSRLADDSYGRPNREDPPAGLFGQVYYPRRPVGPRYGRDRRPELHRDVESDRRHGTIRSSSSLVAGEPGGFRAGSGLRRPRPAALATHPSATLGSATGPRRLGPALGTMTHAVPPST